MLTGRYPNSVASKLHAQGLWARTVKLGVHAVQRVNPSVTAMFWFATDNFGDALAPYMVRTATGLQPYLAVAPCANRLLSTGSIVHRSAPGDVLWGTGSLEPGRIGHADDLTVVAVRGPLTAEALGLSSRPTLPMGDPVQLLPRFHPRPHAPVRGRVGLIPHHADLRKLARRALPGVSLINPLSHWPKIVDQIVQCEVVVSSSLHGIIAAEAYGVPAVWISIGELPYGGAHKFHDYLLASGRNASRPVAFDPDLPLESICPLPAPEPVSEAFCQSAADLPTAMLAGR